MCIVLFNGAAVGFFGLEIFFPRKGVWGLEQRLVFFFIVFQNSACGHFDPTSWTIPCEGERVTDFLGFEITSFYLQGLSANRNKLKLYRVYQIHMF